MYEKRKLEIGDYVIPLSGDGVMQSDAVRITEIHEDDDETYYAVEGTRTCYTRDRLAIPPEAEGARVVLDDTQNGWTAIPNAVLRGNLERGPRLLLCVLMSYAYGEKETCFPGQERLADDLNTTPRTIRRWLDKLKEHGLVEYKRKGFSKSNLYVLKVQEYLDTVRTPTSSMEDAIQDTGVRSVRTPTSYQSGHTRPVNNKREKQKRNNISGGGVGQDVDISKNSEDKVDQDNLADSANEKSDIPADSVSESSDIAAMQSELIEELKTVGFNGARDFVLRYDDELVRSWVAYAGDNPSIRNPGGFIREKVRAGEKPPEVEAIDASGVHTLDDVQMPAGWSR
jgi:DNA-binding transcriptional ArsR family regulator